MKLVFDKEMQPQNKAEIKRHLMPLLWLVPKWCQKINITVYGNNGTASASTEVSDEYRFADMNFYGDWFTQSEEFKRDAVIHELLHIQVNPVFHLARRAASQIGNSELQDFIKNELALAIEKTTQDLTYSIHSMLKDKEVVDGN